MWINFKDGQVQLSEGYRAPGLIVMTEGGDMAVFDRYHDAEMSEQLYVAVQKAAELFNIWFYERDAELQALYHCQLVSLAKKIRDYVEEAKK